MNKRLRTWLAALLGGLAMATAGAVHAGDVPESEDPIIIGINEWTGQHIASYIAGHILEKMGYNVEYKTAAVLPMGTAVADGNITLGLELWDNNLGEWWPNQLESGAVEDMGTLGLDAREGWLYPKHVEELCPGLPDWEAFVGCAEVFSTAETFPDGRFIEYRPTGAIGPLSSSRRRACPSRRSPPEARAPWWRSSRPRWTRSPPWS